MKNKGILTLILTIILSLMIASCGISSKVSQDTDSNSEIIETQDLEQIDGYLNQVLIDGFLGDLDTQLLILPDAEKAAIIEGSLVYQSDLSLDEAQTFFQNAISKLGVDEEKVQMIDGEGSFQFVITDINQNKSLVLKSEKIDDSTIQVTLKIQ